MTGWARVDPAITLSCGGTQPPGSDACAQGWELSPQEARP
jgi:hypothetical protein